MKAYIITSPCSGKTATARHYSHHDGLVIFDHNDLTEMFFDREQITIQSTENEKAELLLSYLDAQLFPSCILGSYMPTNPTLHPEIKIIIVIIPKHIHYFYTLKRRVRSILGRIHEGIPLTKCIIPTDRWDEWQNTSAHRDQVKSYATKHNLPVYRSLQDAITTLLNRLLADQKYPPHNS
jgi:hypothetical protein